MADTRFYFWIGLALGIAIGGVVTLLYAKIRGLFSGQEVRKLRQENRTLKQRIDKKDKHIQEMMHHAEQIATGLAEQAKERNKHET